MAKRKGRSPKGPHIKNGNLIGKGDKLPVVKDNAGNRNWVESKIEGDRIKAAKPTRSPQIKEAKEQQMAKAPASPLNSMTSLTPPSRAKKLAGSPKIEAGASKIISSQKDVKPAIKSPAPSKKPPTPGR